MPKEKDPAPADDKPLSDPNEPMGDPVADNPNPDIVADASGGEPAPAAAADEDGEAAPPPYNPRAEAMKRAGERMKQRRAAEEGRTEPEPEPAPAPEPTPQARESGPSDSAPAAAAPAAEAAPAPAPAPKRFKLKVDDQEFDRDLPEIARLADMTVEEVEANPDRATRYAQKELASSRRLDQAKEILRGANQRQAPAPNQEPDDAEPVPEPAPAQPGKFKKLIEDIQFGADPEALAAQLQEALTEAASTVATTAAQTASVAQRFQEDHATTIAAFEKLKTADSALFSDPNALAVMTRMMFDGYRDDLRASGVPDDRIPQDNKALVDAHRLSRIQGKPGIRPAEKFLGDVKESYVKWRGGTATTTPAAAPDPAPPPSPAPRPAPRVVLNRDERRQAIPTQPTRASAPPPLPAAPAQPKTREQKMATMRAARGQR